MKKWQKAKSYLALNNVALLEDLDNDILLLGAAKLGLKSALGGSVEGALVSVAVGIFVSYDVPKSFEAAQYMAKRPMVGQRKTYLWVTKTLKLSTT